MISIIIPVYNAEKTLKDTFDSILVQTYKDYEVIIIDDASKDESAAIIQEYCQQHFNWQAIYNDKNHGVGYCRNIGINKAQGEWIALLDSDDKWEKDKLEKQLQCVEKHAEANLFYTGSAFMNGEGKRLNSVMHVKEQVNYAELLHQNIISCSSVLVRKKEMEKYPFSDNMNCHEDFAAWLKILREDPWAYGIDEPLLIYRLSASSKSGNKFRSFVMSWNTYRSIGLNVFEAAYNMIFYSLNGLKKYARIKLNHGEKNE